MRAGRSKAGPAPSPGLSLGSQAAKALSGLQHRQGSKAAPSPRHSAESQQRGPRLGAGQKCGPEAPAGPQNQNLRLDNIPRRFTCGTQGGPLHLGQAHLLGAPSRRGLLEALRDGERPQGTRHVSHNQLRSLPSPGGAWGMGKGTRSGSSRTSKTGPTEAERSAGVGVASPHTWGQHLHVLLAWLCTADTSGQQARRPAAGRGRNRLSAG